MSSNLMINSMVRSYLSYSSQVSGDTTWRTPLVTTSSKDHVPRLYRICGISWPLVQPATSNTCPLQSGYSMHTNILREKTEPIHLRRRSGDYIPPGLSGYQSNHTFQASLSSFPFNERRFSPLQTGLNDAINAFGSLPPDAFLSSECSTCYTNKSNLDPTSTTQHTPPQPTQHTPRNHDYASVFDGSGKSLEISTVATEALALVKKGWDRLRPLAPAAIDTGAAARHVEGGFSDGDAEHGSVYFSDEEYSEVIP